MFVIAKRLVILIVFCSLFLAACRKSSPGVTGTSEAESLSGIKIKPKLSEISSPEIRSLLESAFKQIEITKTYDPAYVVIDFPNGDVPPETGVCTDVVIRAFRNAGIDLQKEIHEDMRENFSLYPQKWGLKKTDTNIDHRRVPNVQKFFERMGKSLPVTGSAENYLPGDIISWDLDGRGITHIGIVSNILDAGSGRYLIVHNIGSGVKAEDVLFEWEITGHYRYF